jgi:hypothetical protein
MKPTLQTFKPMKGKIFVTDLERGMSKTAGGIIITDDNMKNHGIKARWGRVAIVASDVDFVSPGEWVLVEHGRWTMGMDYLDADTGKTVMVWMVEPKAMMLATQEDPRPAGYSF